MEYKLDYDLPAKQKDLATTMDYQNTNASLSQPVNVAPVETNNTNVLKPVTTGGERLGA